MAARKKPAKKAPKKNAKRPTIRVVRGVANAPKVLEISSTNVPPPKLTASLHELATKDPRFTEAGLTMKELKAAIALAIATANTPENHLAGRLALALHTIDLDAEPEDEEDDEEDDEYYGEEDEDDDII